MALAVEPQRSIAGRVESILNQVHIKVARSEQEREEIYRFRYRCYRHEGTISPQSAERFEDRFDELENAYLFGIWQDSRLISSLRLHIGARAASPTPSMSAFGDVLGEFCERGETFVDPTRFTIDAEVRGATGLMPHVTLRLASMAADHFDTDHIIATPRPEHVPFYKRIFGLELRTTPRAYPGLNSPLALMSNHTGIIRDRVYTRFPMFSSDPEERNALFGEHIPAALRSEAFDPTNDNGPDFRRYPANA